jgi:hypothetical protein
MCGRITVRQFIRELHLWLKMRMIGVVMIGWTRCLMLDAIQLELETNCEDPPTPEVQKFLTCLKLQKSRCMNTRQ